MGIMDKNNGDDPLGDYDQTGALYYVVAVILVYGMSIVMLIASHIKRRRKKITEDKQINKYLQDFQIVKERHARESYRNLKKTIMKKINWDKQNKQTFFNLQQSIMPLIAVGMLNTEEEGDDKSISSSLSNVDIAAAKQHMIAKEKGKIHFSRRPSTSNAITAAYFAAARRLSAQQSPQNIAAQFNERRRSPASLPPPPIPMYRIASQPSRNNSGIDPDDLPAIYIEEPYSPGPEDCSNSLEDGRTGPLNSSYDQLGISGHPKSPHHLDVPVEQSSDPGPARVFTFDVTKAGAARPPASPGRSASGRGTHSPAGHPHSPVPPPREQLVQITSL